MGRLVIICIFIFHLSVTCWGQFPGIEPPQAKESDVVDPNSKHADSVDPSVDIVISKAASQNTTTSKPTTGINVKSNTNSDVIESGAVMRGIFVFVGITLLLIMYLVFKIYRTGNKKRATVKKYGVRTRRTDTEMEPLPLDDEEEDETVFELKNVNNR